MFGAGIRRAAISWVLGAGDAAFHGHRGGACCHLLFGHTADLHDHWGGRSTQHAYKRPELLCEEPRLPAAALWHFCSSVHAPGEYLRICLQTCVITCVNTAISGNARKNFSSLPVSVLVLITRSSRQKLC